jgi:GT2 family glycosyltransferase
MSLPDISVVIVTYNRPGLLKRILEALAEQEGACIEIIVTDDGSDPRPVIEEMVDTYLWTEDRGYDRGGALNRGVERARAPHLLLMDDDCVPRSSQFCRAHLDELANARVCAGQLWIWQTEKDGEPVGDPVLAKGEWFTTANLSIERELFLEIGGFDPVFTGAYGEEDVDLGIRLEERGVDVVFGGDDTAVDHIGRFFPQEQRSLVNRWKLYRKWPERFPELSWNRRIWEGLKRRWLRFFGSDRDA